MGVVVAADRTPPRRRAGGSIGRSGPGC